jgi:hypothetical protein
VQVIDKEQEMPVTYEYVVCPYCGGLDFEEYKETSPRPAPKPTPPVQMPTPVTKSNSQFDPADLMQHSWKGKKIGQGKYEQGSLAYGWDYADQFKPETVEALKRGVVEIDEFVFKITENFKLVQTKKVRK